MSAAIRYLIPAIDWHFIKKHIDAIPSFDTCGLVCEDSETKEFYGAVIFDQMTLNSAQCHICMPRPIQALRAGLLEAGSVHVFLNLDKKVLIGLTPSNNHKATAFNRHFGFKEIYRIKDAFSDGEDAIVYEMRREHCRWLPPKEPIVDDYTLGEVRHCG